MNAFPVTIGSGDRSSLPSQNASRGGSNPRGDPRVFFSAATDYFPRQGSIASTSDRFWYQVPGAVNTDLLTVTPDSVALQRLFRNTGNLALLATLVRADYPAAAAGYRAAALLALEGPFLGAAPLRPDLEWARAIPRRGELSAAAWRVNHAGFLEMNGIVGLFDTLLLLQPPPAKMDAFKAWVRCELCICACMHACMGSQRSRSCKLHRHLRERHGALRACLPSFLAGYGHFYSLVTPRVAAANCVSVCIFASNT
jgi:hypothetical protein